MSSIRIRYSDVASLTVSIEGFFELKGEDRAGVSRIIDAVQAEAKRANESDAAIKGVDFGPANKMPAVEP